MSHSEYTITEAGFGADLGAEKFFNIKCRKADIAPKVTVIVVTTQALKMHGGVDIADIKNENTEGLVRGFKNLDKHIQNMKSFGQQVIVTLNKFATDSAKEIELLQEHCADMEVTFAINEAFAKGGEGAIELAKVVVEQIEKNPSKPISFTYDDDDSIDLKIEKVVKNIYGGAKITFSANARKGLKEIEKLKVSHYPVCIAKTQYSFSDDSTAYGVPTDFNFSISDIIINNGAEFIVAVAGDIMRMPGLPGDPQANHIDIVDGIIEGLS